MEVFISQHLGFASRTIQEDQLAERKTKQIAEREYKQTNMLTRIQMDRDLKAIPQAQQAPPGLVGAPSFQPYQLTSQSISCQETRPACLWVMESETARGDTASPSGMETRAPEERHVSIKGRKQRTSLITQESTGACTGHWGQGDRTNS